MEDCIFCKIVKGEVPSCKVYEDERVYVFEDINPLSDGHTLIIPKQHAATIWEISEDDLMAVQKTAKRLAEAMSQALEATDVACVQLNGPGVNQVVPHYHLHLIPRIKGAPEIDLTKWELKPGDMDRINQIGEKLAAAMA